MKSKDYKPIVSKRFELDKVGGSIMSFEVQQLFDTADELKNKIVADTAKSIEQFALNIAKGLDPLKSEDSFGRYAMEVTIGPKRYVIYYQKRNEPMTDIDIVKIYISVCMACINGTKNDAKKQQFIAKMGTYNYKGLSARNL